MNANRAIFLTPAGGAAIAVVRLAGPAAGAFLRAHFSRPAREGRCVHGELTDGERVIDDPVVVLHPGGSGADVNLHGGPWVIRATLDLARRAGFEVVESPGLPLPDDAIDAGNKLQREILSHLPLARTELAARVLLGQERAWESLFAAPLPSGTSEAALHADWAAILADRSLWWLLHPPRVAIVGAPNVGKSTLANQLFARERSITADLPGTTRDWVGELADVNGLAVMLVDTPGLRDAADPIEHAAIAGARGQIASADLVVLVLDPTQPLAPEQSPLIAAHPDAIPIINKSDQPAKWQLPDDRAIHTVATTGQGIEELRRVITARFGCDRLDLRRPRWWTERQREFLEREIRNPKHGPLRGKSEARSTKPETSSETEKKK